jgi:hypothetical protein
LCAPFSCGFLQMGDVDAAIVAIENAAACAPAGSRQGVDVLLERARGLGVSVRSCGRETSHDTTTATGSCSESSTAGGGLVSGVCLAESELCGRYVVVGPGSDLEPGCIVVDDMPLAAEVQCYAANCALFLCPGCARSVACGPLLSQISQDSSRALWRLFIKTPCRSAGSGLATAYWASTAARM